MQRERVSLWCPIRATRLDSAERASYTEEAIGHLVVRLGRTLQTLSSHLTNVTVASEDPPDFVISALIGRSSLVSLGLYSMIHIEADVTFDETQPAHPSSAGPIEELYWSAFFSYYLKRAFEAACMAMQLARPGSLLIGKGATFLGENSIEEVDGLFDLGVAESIEDLQSEWPTLVPLDLVDVTEWIIAIGVIEVPVARTRLQRTFAAFSHLSAQRPQSNEGEQLFRAMQGLEAFYCDGVGDLRRQLAEKAKLWLGSGAKPANLVGKLYDLRSKYVHGVATMTYAIGMGDPELHAPKELNEVYSGVDLAKRMLVATLQQSIAKRAFDVTWSYGYKIHCQECDSDA